MRGEPTAKNTISSAALLLASLALAGPVCGQERAPSTVSQASATPLSVAPPPITEDFGMSPFGMTASELASGHAVRITSPEQAHIWAALMLLLSTDAGLHTKDEVANALGVTMEMTRPPEARGDFGFWRAHLANVDIVYFGDDDTSKDGRSAYLSAAWQSPVTEPSCISAQRALADVQLAGGKGFLQLGLSRRFRLSRGEEVEVESNALPQGCVTDFLLVSRQTSATVTRAGAAHG